MERSNNNNEKYSNSGNKYILFIRKVFVEIANTPLTVLFIEFVLNQRNKINCQPK